MAWTITNEKREGVPGNVPQIVIVCDSASDVAGLPTDYAAGSIAIIAGSGLPVYVLNASGTWVSAE